MEAKLPLSIPQTMPLLVPFEETEGTGPEKLNECAATEVGEVEISPLPLALNEYALSGSAAPVVSLPPDQYRYPFQ